MRIEEDCAHSPYPTQSNPALTRPQSFSKQQRRQLTRVSATGWEKVKCRADYGEGWGRNSYPSCAHLSVNETFHSVTQSDAHYFSRVTGMLHAESTDQSGYSHGSC